MGDGDSSSDSGGSDDGGGVQDEAEQRQHERTEHVEGILAEVRDDLGDQKYPVSSEELAAVYADQTIDLPNETESLGSAFGRLDEQFEDEQAAYAALVAEIGGDEGPAGRPDGARRPTWSEERAETQHAFRDDPIDDEGYESSVERSRERAREAQAESASAPETETEPAEESGGDTDQPSEEEPRE